ALLAGRRPGHQDRLLFLCRADRARAGVPAARRLQGVLRPRRLPTIRGGAVIDKALSQREAEVLALIADGYEMRAIAVQLNVSQSAAACYRRRLFLKLGAHTA